MTGYTLAVSRGAKWLDSIAPGWHECVDPDELDMGSWKKCIIGQLVRLGKLDKKAEPGVYPFDIRMIGWCTPKDSEWLIRQGFMARYDQGDFRLEDELLANAWKKLIERRLKRKAVVQ